MSPVKAFFVTAPLSFVLLAVLLLPAGQRSTDLELRKATPEQRAAAHERLVRAAEESVKEQARLLGCDILTPTLTDYVAVRPAGRTKDGVFDTGVVSKVPFDEALRLSQEKKVYVIAWCR